MDGQTLCKRLCSIARTTPSWQRNRRVSSGSWRSAGRSGRPRNGAAVQLVVSGTGGGAPNAQRTLCSELQTLLPAAYLERPLRRGHSGRKENLPG